jgi:hypothetical protein
MLHSPCFFPYIELSMGWEYYGDSGFVLYLFLNEHVMMYLAVTRIDWPVSQ